VIPDWTLPLLRFAFLAGVLALVVQAVRAVFINLEVPPAPFRGRTVLVVESPEALRGETFVVSGEAVIGRASPSTVILRDDHVSSRHARLFERGGWLWVEDLRSTNGTLLNGGPVRYATPVRTGDRLALGDVVLTLREEIAESPHTV
jgi:pSer/pThr/pTyr-binding forkhead associated (FHA) protein